MNLENESVPELATVRWVGGTDGYLENDRSDLAAHRVQRDRVSFC